MKSAPTTPAGKLQGGNLNRLREVTKTVAQREHNLGLLFLIADMLDEIAAGSNLYMVIGSTKDMTSYSVTVRGDKAPSPMYGQSLSDLSDLAKDLL